jgi:predicted dehydrogenase
MSSLRTAVVGVGYLGRFHGQKHQQLGTLKYVCDASSTRAAEVAKELHCESVTNPKDLLGQVDAVTIAADTRSHYELAKLFLENGTHVFIEKPICTTVAEATEIVELGEKKNLKIQVGHIERYNPAFQTALPLVDHPHYINIQRIAPYKPRSLSVDVVLDLMIHDLDIAIYLAGSKIKDIRANGAKVITQFNDLCDAWLTFENGTECSILTSRIDSKTVRSIQLSQKTNVVQIDLGAMTVHQLSKSSGEVPLQTKSFEVTRADAMLAETKDFFHSITENRNPSVTGRDGLEALRAAEWVLELTR